MKAIKIFGIIILTGIIVVFAFFYFAFSSTTWGGWTPPDASLELNSEENIWVQNFEKRNKCHFDYIGLDNGYTEDSIIYMNLYLTKKSNLEENISKDGEIFTKEVCQSFLNSSTKARTQNYVKLTYYTNKFKDEKYHKVSYLYSKYKDSIVKIE